MMTARIARKRATRNTSWLASVFGLIGAIAGCDREPAPTPPAPSTRPVAQVLVAAPAGAVLTTLAVLAPNAATHIAIDRTGVVYYTQQTPGGTDLVLRLGERELPEPTSLSSASIAEAAGKRGMPGNIVALTANPGSRGDRMLYFLWIGTGGKQSTFILGQYDIGSATVRVLADTASMVEASRLGASIELATPGLVRTGTLLWLTLGTLDQTVVLQIDLARTSSKGLATLRQPFRNIRTGDETLQVNRGGEQLLSPGPFDSDEVYLTDTWTGGLFRIDPQGHATLLSSIIGLPRALTPAAAIDANGKAVTFLAAESEEITPQVETRIEPVMLKPSGPCALVFDGTSFTVIGRDRITTRPGLPKYALRPRGLTASPDGTFVTYDAASGELLRVRVE